MDKKIILEILNDWNFWKKELPSGKKRKEYLKKFAKFLKSNIVVTILGIRRAGKSYLMRQIAKELIKKHTPPKNILIINFEDVRFTEFYPEMLQEIYNAYIEYLSPTSKQYIFLDEIHNVPKWERWVRTMQELGKAKLIISGSSSKLLEGELATVLTGRHLDIHVYPLNFKEFLDFKNISIKEKIDIVSQKKRINKLFKEYLEWGGFPEVALSSNKKELLLNYFNDILTKDIEKRYQIKKYEILRTLSRFYLTNISRPITFNSIRKFLNCSTVTIKNFSSYLEEANLIFFTKSFSFSLKEQDNSPRKVYSIDTGLANAIGFKFSENKGWLIENIVATELKRKTNQNPNLEFFYWKHNHKEVDFIVKEGLKIKTLIQVCWNIEDFEVEKREIKPLIEAMDKFNLKHGIIITEEYSQVEKIKGKTIKYISIIDWLLEN